MPNNDSHQHVVKTTAQWDERAVEYWIVPRGCLCVELTPEGKTKLKVGEGNKYFKQLPYICDHGDLTNYYTKEEVDNLFDNLNRMAIMSTDVYDSADDLPSNDNKLGDVRFVKSSTTTDPDLYVWIGDRWIDVNSSDIDPSDFVTKPEFNAVKDKVDEIYPKAHTHANKDILDGITQADRDKFDDLHNYDDTELRELIARATHVHPNKALLDTITTSSLWSIADRTKFDDLHNYDDTEVKVRLVAVEEKAHTHANKTVLDGITQEKLDAIDELAATYVIVTRDIADLKTKSHTHANKDLLDGTTASFTVEQQNELYRLSQISTFIGAGPTWDGIFGYVPAPEAGQQTYYLRADGTWSKVKTGGDKYKAGEGIYILSGEVATDTFPFKVYSKSARLKQYVIYGAIGGVGDQVSSSPRIFNIPITVTSDDYGTRQSIITTADPLYEGDYIDYSRQVFVHTRTNIMSQLRVDSSSTYKTGVYADGTIGYFNPGAYGDMPNVTAPFELDPGAAYEIPAFSTWTNTTVWNNFKNGIHVNMYDANMNRTRTISLSFDNATLITPTASEKYLRMTCWRDSNMNVTQPAFIQIKDVETPVILQEVVLYPNTINTIDVATTVKPSEIYVEVDDPPDEQSEDPMSEYTGIIYNDGVIDVEQDETDLNTLIFHYRDEVTKSFTIPGGGGSGNYVAGDGISIEPESPLRVTHIKWVLLDIRNRASAGNIIQVGEFQLYDTNDQLISYSSINGIFGNGTSPTYGTNQYPQTPDKLIDGDLTRKMCCTNFTTNCGGLEITMELVTPIDVHDLKQYRYITGNDSPERDPVSWTLYASTDGSTWELIDTRNNETISTVRTTPTDDYVITQNTNLAINNEGVVDITQEDPNNLNELTVHFRDTTSTITVPGTEYTAGTGIDIGGSIIYNKHRAIPSDQYREVLYIESDGTNYIMTDLTPASDTAYQLFWESLDLQDLSTQALVGTDTIVNGQHRNSAVFYEYYNNTVSFAIMSGTDSAVGTWATPVDSYLFNSGQILNAAPGQRAYQVFTCTYDNTGGYSNTTVRQSSGMDYSGKTNPQPFAIFGANTYDSDNDTHDVVNRSKYRYHWFVLFSGNQIQTEYITHILYPCYRLSDGRIGVYDVNTNVFYPANSNSGFTLGADLVDIVPDTNNTISAKIGRGLTVDSIYGNITNAGVLDITQDQLSPNTLTVKFANSQKDITIPGGSGGNNNYRAGDGIEITTIYPPQQGFQVEDTDYFFDTNVQCTIGGRTFTKYTTDPALGVICHARINSGGGQSTVYSGPMFFGLSENAVKVHNDYSGGQTEGSMGTFEYKGYTWYISAHNYMNDGTTIVDGGIPRIDDLVFTFDGNGEIELGKMVIDLAGLITDPIDEFSAKLGNGLQFDDNEAIEAIPYVAGTGIDIESYAPARLPVEYQEVEYIASDGVTQNYINTGIHQPMTVVIDMKYNTNATQQYMGWSVTGKNRYFGVDTYSTYNLEETPGAVTGIDLDVTERRTITVSFRTGQASTMTIEGQTITNFTTEGSDVYTTNDFLLFTLDTTNYFSNATIYEVTIYDTNFQPIFHGIPCYRVSDDVSGLYDLVTETFKPSIGGNLAVGPDVIPNNSYKIINTGLLSVEQDQLDPNHLTFETIDGDIDVTIPDGGNQYVRVNTTDSYVLLHTKPADWDDHWDKYFELTYDEITTSPPDWDPTKHYKYENDNYVLGTAGDTFVSTTWYDKHYNGLDPNTAVTFDSDVYYTGDLQLIEDGETYDTAFAKINEAIEHIERLEGEVDFLKDDRVGVRVTSTPERIEFYNT